MARDTCASIMGNFIILIVNLQSLVNGHPIYISVVFNLLCFWIWNLLG